MKRSRQCLEGCEVSTWWLSGLKGDKLMGRRFKKDFQVSLEDCVDGGIIYHSGQCSKRSGALGQG